MHQRPVVGLVCDRRVIEEDSAHLVLQQYVSVVRDGIEALPLLIPVLDPPLDCTDILSAMDGLLFTGSPSNVHPELYGGAPAREPKWEDRDRDALCIPLIKAAVAAGLPTVCVCRGMQELNVALGGTLHQHVQELPGRIDHREKANAPREVQWSLAHDVIVTPGGLLAELTGKTRFTVNSLHGQGIDRLAPSLRVEAHATDGQIEAVSLIEPKGFLLGLQWHPEWHWSEDLVSRAIWQAFAAALAKRRLA
ncbi:MAG: gamma-glutamyl-gamma-aminobutyrate hydrolase family protein [Rhizomicrobium sp.]|nr:gamma-glutamyl-gamma-aminobutyrate hydrolase family protein [Rhizomicrobium sp.]